MEREHKNSTFQDGWDNLSQSSQESVQLVSLYHRNIGRSILDQQYSLEPDMATGWIPKLPSCPIPLTYQNSLIHAVLQKIELDPRFRIIYRGPRHINSVQLHKNNNYFWKYRQKYEVKINLISEAVQKVGKQNEPVNLLRQHYRYSSFQDQITFDSDFESGNLDLAVRVKPTEFDCFIRSDTNTRGHTNWYNFKLSNKKYVGPVQLNICNIVKTKNLYNKGMTPYTFAKNVDKIYQTDIEWKQNQCYDVEFVQRLCRYGTNRVENQLQFKYDFKEENMEVNFAYSIPYTFTYLQEYVNIIKQNSLVKVTNLCQSFGGLQLPLITISKEERTAKINIVIVGRIHPGETNSSHMLEGLINSLLQNNSIANRLLSAANFYIIPMINPDGVVAGNYRTSFSGRDLNRSFKQIGHFAFPQLNSLVNFIKKLKSQRKKVDFFFDFHSHSSLKDLFCYGPEHSLGTLHYFRSRILVKILEKQSAMFSAQKCLYNISEHKKGTARSYMLRSEKIPMTFTFEVSNGIFSINKKTQATFDKKSLLYAGKIIIMGLSEYFCLYHKDIASQPRLKVIKFKDDRLSFSINQKGYCQLKKPKRGSRSQDLSAVDIVQSSNDIKTMMNEILEQKPCNEPHNERQSDSESSDHDMAEEQLNNLFSIRKNFNIKTDLAKSLQSPVERPAQRFSLKKIRSKKQVLKSAMNTVDLTFKDNSQQKQSPRYFTKYRKNRVYYEQTHPRAAKKVFENSQQSKKPLKQKRFPILF